ncbi:MAG: tryptophan-rich sensory protein [Calditrichia bacterium]
MVAYSKSIQIAGLIGWLAISYITAAIGGAASVKAGSFFSEMVRPSWAPPGWLFGPVWSVLYTMMGISAWLVWRTAGFQTVKVALILFIVQLLFNGLWSWLFFRWHLGLLSFLDIVILWGLIVATLVAFWRISPLAGGLLIPYLLWVSFAAVLNFTLWRLNPHLLG